MPIAVSTSAPRCLYQRGFSHLGWTVDLDWASIAEKLIVMAVGGGATWVLTTTRRLTQELAQGRSDTNAAFAKLRALEAKFELLSGAETPPGGGAAE